MTFKNSLEHKAVLGQRQHRATWHLLLQLTWILLLKSCCYKYQTLSGPGFIGVA